MNWIGLWTLYRKEVHRYIKVAGQTITAPVITTLLFMAVFVLALGREDFLVGGLPFINFLAPGLIMMALAQNAFANSSSSLIIAKVNGTIVDVLMPPLSAFELTLGYAMGSVTRGIMVGCVVLVALLPFVSISIYSPLLLVAFAVLGSLMLGLLGILAGIWSEKFDQVAFVTNFVVTPLSFLSGTFYSIERLPEFWRDMASWNPFFHMIDGARYAMTGYEDGSWQVGLASLIIVNVLLWSMCHLWFTRGYKIKA
jgi:ABC-2 type transport system permease protein